MIFDVFGWVSHTLLYMAKPFPCVDLFLVSRTHGTPACPGALSVQRGKALAGVRGRAPVFDVVNQGSVLSVVRHRESKIWTSSKTSRVGACAAGRRGYSASDLSRPGSPLAGWCGQVPVRLVHTERSDCGEACPRFFFVLCKAYIGLNDFHFQA